MKDLQKLTDEQVVEHVRKEDPEAYREIMARYQNKLLRYAHYLTNNEMDSADIVQNTFIKVFINLNGFNIEKKFSSWIYRITHNEAVNILAKRKNELPILENINFKNEKSIEDSFNKKQEKEKLSKCLSRMPIKYAEPLSLFFLEEKSYEEISDILRIPIGTVGTRINRAKILIKKICEMIQK
jgi:RNA polymerase sigma-70 factor (ECF subfamily)